MRRTLIVAAVVCSATALVVAAASGPRVAPAPMSAGIVQTPSDRDPLVGTYRLVGRELKNADGTWSPSQSFESTGYITYSAAGYMGVHVMPSNRTAFGDGGPTPEEAQAALRGYTAYFGPYTVHADGADDPFVVHHRQGQINPSGDPDAKRFFDIDGSRLILTPAPASGGKAQAPRRVLWERLPDAPLSAEARKFVGFRALLYTDRYTERDGQVVEHDGRNESRAGSYIIYTPTGHMMVHLMAAEGRGRYAGASPTPEEALSAYRSFGGYFGRFTVYEDADPPYVVHNQEGRPRPPGAPSDAVRLYQFSGDVLRLGGRPRTRDGEATGGHLYWRVLPPR